MAVDDLLCEIWPLVFKVEYCTNDDIYSRALDGVTRQFRLFPSGPEGRVINSNQHECKRNLQHNKANLSVELVMPGNISRVFFFFPHHSNTFYRRI